MKLSLHIIPFGALLLLVSFSTSVPSAHAANGSLYVSPATGIYPIGEPFTVEVRLDSDGTTVGSADATLAFETADLEFVSVSDDGSIFNTILVDSSRAPGRVDISGLITRGNAAWAGRDGLVARVTFIPRRNAATQVRLENGTAKSPLSLTASVAQSVDALATLRHATYTLVPREVVPAAVAFAATPSESAITASPEPTDDWFATTTVKLSWSLPDGVTEMRTGLSTDPAGVPTKVYQVPVSSITQADIPEGKNFFHLQFIFGETEGKVMHHPLDVDLTGPSSVVISEVTGERAGNAGIGFTVEAVDPHSGVAKYDMSIDGSPAVAWDREKEPVYVPRDLDPGEHTLTATVFDKMGHSTSADHVFLIRSLLPPTLTSIDDRVLTGDTITVHGTTYPASDVTVYVSFNDGEATTRSVTSDSSGAFSAAVADAARTGKYTVWFSVKDDTGAVSPSSIKRSVHVSQPFIMLFGTVAVTYLSVIVPLIGLILLLGLVLWLGFTWARGFRKRVGRETQEAYTVAQAEFDDLRRELTKQIGMLERANQSRELTREEMRIFQDLSRRLDQIERHIANEIEDIAPVEENEERPEPHRSRMRERAAEEGGIVNRPLRHRDMGGPITPPGHTLKIERR